MENVIGSLSSKKLIIRLTILSQLVVFVLLIIQGVLSAKYRVTYGDASYVLYKIITEKNFFTAHNRFINSLCEYLPLLGTFLNLKFKYIAILYSINYTISAFILYLIYSIYTQKWHLAWVIILVQIIGMHNGYNYLVPDHFGYSLMVFDILILDFLINERDKNYFWASTILIVFSAIVCHQVSFIILGIGYIFLFFSHKNFRKNFLIQGGIVLIFYFIYRKFLIPINNYENSKIDNIISNLYHYKTLDKAAYRYYFDMVYRHNKYLDFFYILILVVGVYYKKYFELFLILIFSLVSYYFSCIIFYEWESSGYMEYYSAIIFISILLGFYFMIKDKPSNWFILFFFVYVFHFSIQNIYSFQKQYKDREIYISKLNKVSREWNTTKMYINRSFVNYNSLLLDWAIAYESMNSCLFREESLVTIFIAEDSKQVEKLADNEFCSSIEVSHYKAIKNTVYGQLKYEPYVIYKGAKLF